MRTTEVNIHFLIILRVVTLHQTPRAEAVRDLMWLVLCGLKLVSLTFRLENINSYISYEYFLVISCFVNA